MPPSVSELDAIVIESPCTVPWASMAGDDVTRFCGQCRLNVHDVSQMTRAEAGELLRTTGRACCLRVWRRPDGRVITRDCNRVRRALRRRVQALRAAAASLFALLGLGGCGGSKGPDAPHDGAGPEATPAAAPVEKPPVPGATVLTGR